MTKGTITVRTIFGRDPALIAALLEGIVLAATTFLTDWDAETVGVIQLVVTLVLALYVKWGTVTEVTAVILQLSKALLVLLVTFGVNLSADRQAVLLGLVAAAVAAFTRTQVTAITPPPPVPVVPGSTPVTEVR
jgi:hypothetical protein